jgi:hypothetical protein
MSQPHFLNADDKFINSVNGLSPNKDLHDFVLHFEPVGLNKFKLSVSEIKSYIDNWCFCSW